MYLMSFGPSSIADDNGKLVYCLQSHMISFYYLFAFTFQYEHIANNTKDLSSTSKLKSNFSITKINFSASNLHEYNNGNSEQKIKKLN